MDSALIHSLYQADVERATREHYQGMSLKELLDDAGFACRDCAENITSSKFFDAKGAMRLWMKSESNLYS